MAPPWVRGSPLDHLERVVTRTIRENYTTAAELSEAVEEQLPQSVEKGQAIQMSEAEARQKYGDSLVIDFLGALVNLGSKTTGDFTVCLLYDGTSGVQVNKWIRVRDQDKAPSAPDIKLVRRLLANELALQFAFKLDIEDAHRLVPARQEDWHLLECRSAEGRDVYVNVTVTFWVASAAYWWSRVATAAV